MGIGFAIAVRAKQIKWIQKDIKNYQIAILLFVS